MERSITAERLANELLDQVRKHGMDTWDESWFHLWIVSAAIIVTAGLLSNVSN